METKRKKKLFNVIMTALIAVVVLCGIMAVGTLKGWFGGGDSAVISNEMSGVVNIERSGVAYALDKKIAIEEGDIVETKDSSFASFTINGENHIAMNESAEISFTACDEECVGLRVDSGELFAEIPAAPAEMKVALGENVVNVPGAVFSVSAQSGSHEIRVYSGQLEVTAADGSVQTVKSGEYLGIIQSTGENFEIEKGQVSAEALSGFVIGKLQDRSSKNELCFSQDELKKVMDTREKENKNAQNADGDVITASGSNASGTKNSGSSKNVNTCTIQIRCGTILDNMGNLTAGKDRYVPSNGIILATSSVEFTDGETVFDVLKRVCSYAGIQLEYSYTPLYESYYIEGINNLYEFDCGPQSGWMYKVNGWFPNYGCSGYKLKDGDNIVWTYTCNGLGADVGGNVR